MIHSLDRAKPRHCAFFIVAATGALAASGFLFRPLARAVAPSTAVDLAYYSKVNPVDPWDQPWRFDDNGLVYSSGPNELDESTKGDDLFVIVAYAPGLQSFLWEQSYVMSRSAIALLILCASAWVLPQRFPADLLALLAIALASGIVLRAIDPVGVGAILSTFGTAGTSLLTIEVPLVGVTAMVRALRWLEVKHGANK